MKKYLRLMYNSLASAITYRANFAVSFAVIALPFILAIIFWKGVYQNGNTLSGYSLGEIITYYFLVLLIQDFNYPVLNYDVVSDIKDGNLNFLLIKPVGYFWYAFFLRFGSHLIYFIVVILFLSIYVLIFGSLLILNFSGFLRFLPVAILGYFLASLVSFFFSILTLFLENFQGLQSFIDFVVPLFSGILIPLPILPGFLRVVSNLLPFRLMISYPIGFYLGNEGFGLRTLVSYLFWFGLFILLNTFLWKEGLKRYRAVGG